jgi:hypothetical protein
MAKREIYVVFVACVNKCFHGHCVHMPWDSSVAICVILVGKALKLILHRKKIKKLKTKNKIGWYHN